MSMSETINVEKYINALDNLLGSDHAYYAGDPDVDAIMEVIVVAKKLENKVKELETENARLIYLIQEVQQYNEAWVEDNGKLRQEMKTIKDEIVKKMQARLKARAFRDVPVFGEPYSCVDFVIIDQVANEILGEER